MRNHFAANNQGDAVNEAATLALIDDLSFAGDSFIDPAGLGPVHPSLWRKYKTGQVVKIRFPKVPYQEYPKTMYGIDVNPVTVSDEDEEKQARAAGYVDHKEQAHIKPDFQRARTAAVEGHRFAVSAIAG